MVDLFSLVLTHGMMLWALYRVLRTPDPDEARQPEARRSPGR